MHYNRVECQYPMSLTTFSDSQGKGPMLGLLGISDQDFISDWGKEKGIVEIYLLLIALSSPDFYTRRYLLLSCFLT